ncbi:hypothetical protein LXT12_07505 [Pelomonas sp. P7]|uniref:Uncharacterized protein n=1 Tax=Pelomonas caseinilytica TaxID=2906763 RepID=A0ABS8XDR7_9BURK|nr:hypothetical protein [Pelomonas sp. P7]MCE4537093.1 hypothetical protein [Pelomonas sp. P7]
MRLKRLCLPLALPMALLLALPPAQADAVTAAAKLSQALGVPGLQVKAVPKRRAAQVHQDYAVTDGSGKDIASIIQAPAASFSDWKQVPDFQALTGVGQEAYARPEIDQLCARSATGAACLTLVPGAFPAGKKPSLEQRKAALAALI